MSPCLSSLLACRRCQAFLAAFLHLLCTGSQAQAACSSCTDFQPGNDWGTVSVNTLTEASGLAASSVNPGVLWTHNDGNRERIYAVGTNGALLATFNLKESVDDMEDVAVGPGPVKGVSYLYVGDIGGSQGDGGVRSSVKLLRMPEPHVDPGWAGNPQSGDFDDVQTFNLVYPDGSHDAEALLMDPISGDLLLATKQPETTAVYRVNLNEAANNATLELEFVGMVPFSLASGGDISADGTQVVLRREDSAELWQRCEAEPIGVALGRAGQAIPVIGTPAEPNGEAIAFLREGTGYLTISEGRDPVLYFFQATCPAPPRFTLTPASQSVFVGGTATLESAAAGYPSPTYLWLFNGHPLSGGRDASLVLANLTPANAGLYSITASNSSGVVTATASLVVRAKPDLRITEVQSSPAEGSNTPTGDWWELTSFEPQPVNLSGWRFNDNVGGLNGAFVIGGGVIIGPGESMVFAEGLTLSAFRTWWGIGNLPPNLQVINYSGNGLSLGAAGDGIRLWTAIALDANDTVASVDFGAATIGVTFNYDPVTAGFGSPSQLGVNGSTRADRSNDIGSPGRIISKIISPELGVQLTANDIRIGFQAMVGRRYTLQLRDDLTAAGWTSVGDTLLATNTGRLTLDQPRTSTQRFYRIIAE